MYRVVVGNGQGQVPLKKLRSNIIRHKAYRPTHHKNALLAKIHPRERFILTKAELEKLNHTRIKIGIQGNADSELLMIARVHEYGATITPKATRNLCIPIHKDSYDKSPRDFQDLFFIRSRDGYLFGVVAKKGRRDKDNPNNLKFLFLLLPSVTIPERSFIRAGFDHNKNKLAEIVQNEVARIWQGQQTADGAISWIGGQAVGLIQQFMSDASNFEPKGKIQRERYPSYADSPLMVTGRLRNSITWEVEE